MSRIQAAHEAAGYPYWLVDLTWHTPPANQGQPVERSFASDGADRYYKRTQNHADGSIKYHGALFANLDGPWEAWEPWNTVPPIAPHDWQPL